MPGGKPSPFASAARREAQNILSQPPFKPSHSSAPAPFTGALRTFGRWIAAPFQWVWRHLFVHIGHGFTSIFGSWWPFVAVALAVAAGVLIGTILIRRRGKAPARVRPGAGVRPSVETAEQLDAQARAAEAEGDFATAVRLSFRAGLLRLEEIGVIDDRLATSDTRLRRQLSSQTFDKIVLSHELIAYGDTPATAGDAEEARESWPVLVSAAREELRSSR